MVCRRAIEVRVKSRASKKVEVYFSSQSRIGFEESQPLGEMNSAVVEVDISIECSDGGVVSVEVLVW